jgi:hypothetical protein
MSTSLIELQPVQDTSPSISQRSLSFCVTLRMKVSGTLRSALTSLWPPSLIQRIGVALPAGVPSPLSLTVPSV